MDKSAFDPKKPIYTPGSTQEKLVRIVAVVGFIFALVTILLAIISAKIWPHYAEIIVYSFAAIWAIGSPAWFFYEYFFLYRVAGELGTWEHFKHGQQLAVAIWLSLTGALTTFGASDYVKPPPQKVQLQIKSELNAISLSCEKDRN